MKKEKAKCTCKNKDEKEGIVAGIIAGLIPHIGCIGFIIFTLLGITFFSSVFKSFLLQKWAFPLMIFLSFFLALLSSFFYLKKACCNKTRFLIILFSSVLIINFLLYFLIFPTVSNLSGKSFKVPGINENVKTKIISLQVEIPCSGHAPLIIDELKKMPEVKSVSYRQPNYFDVECDAGLKEEKVLELSIFREFPAEII